MNWQTLLEQVIYPAVALSLPPLIAIGVAYAVKHLGLQTTALQNNAAQNAVTAAVATFAGHVLAQIESGNLSLASVRSGAASSALTSYAASNIAGSVTQLGLTPAHLSDMLVGKVNTLVSPAIVAAAEPVAVAAASSGIPPGVPI